MVMVSEFKNQNEILQSDSLIVSMGEEDPSSSEIDQIFFRLRSVPSNKFCFDCGSQNPTWGCVTYGVFICINCSGIHRSLGVHLTFVRSTLLDIKWTWLQLRQMQLGGNANAELFFKHHNCHSKDPHEKYVSQWAALYREKLLSAATDSIRLHGTKLPLGESLILPEKEEAPTDLFSKVNNGLDSNNWEENAPVLGFLSPESTTSPKKVVVKKQGLGTRKGGLGAQRVKTNFAEIEKEAERADELRRQGLCENVEAPAELSSCWEFDPSVSGGEQAGKPGLSKLDETEYVGIGTGHWRCISHSAQSVMRTIAQENPYSFKQRKERPESGDFVDILNQKIDRKIPNPSDVLKRPKFTFINPNPSQDSAQRKFGSAKSISSDEYFARHDGGDHIDVKTGHSRFHGSTSISSDEYFGRDVAGPGTVSRLPDFGDVKESVKSKVCHVACKLTSLANDVASCLPEYSGD